MRVAEAERLRLGVSQAVRARRARASVYVSLSERVGIPLTLLLPAAPHVMIAHLLTTELDNPFQGAYNVSAEPFARLLQ